MTYKVFRKTMINAGFSCYEESCNAYFSRGRNQLNINSNGDFDDGSFYDSDGYVMDLCDIEYMTFYKTSFLLFDMYKNIFQYYY